MHKKAWLICLLALLPGGCAKGPLSVKLEKALQWFQEGIANPLGKGMHPIVDRITPFPPAYVPWYAKNREKYLNEVPLLPPDGATPPKELQPSDPSDPGDIQWVRAEADKAADGLRSWLAENKMETPEFLLVLNRPLDAQAHLLPYLRTVKTIKWGNDVVTTEEISYQRPGEPAPQQPQRPMGSETIEARLEEQLKRAGLQPLNAPLVWAKACGERATPTMEDLSKHANLLVSVEAKYQAALYKGERLHVLNVTGCVVEFATGRILARSVFYVAAGPPPTPPAGAPAESQGATAILPDLGKLEKATLVMAHCLITQIGNSWAQGVGYHLAVNDLASDVQAREIRRRVERTFKGTDVKDTFVESKEPSGSGGTASFQFKCSVPPSTVAGTLEKPDLFRSFRLGVTERRFTTVTAACIPKPKP